MTSLPEIVERAEKRSQDAFGYEYRGDHMRDTANELVRTALKEYIESLQSAGNNTTAPMRAMVLMGRLSADLALLEGDKKE